MKSNSLQILERKVVECRLCPRLVFFREQVEVKPQFKNEPHWRKPVPGFGDPNATIFILGMAPSINGGNRTGRIFTGDATGDFLFRALYSLGLSNMPTSKDKDDGLKLINCYMTAAVKCVPPNHKPSIEECQNCSQYWKTELSLLPKVQKIVAFGKFAFDVYLKYAKSKNNDVKKMTFEHGAFYHFDSIPSLIASYHPSPQNSNTGKLTLDMLRTVLRKAHS